jgi:gas vesicle protein GvpA/GvpJ/GvpM family
MLAAAERMMAGAGRPAPERPLLDVLDRVLAKGIVILYDVDVSVAGLRIIEISGRTMMMSLETYMNMTEPQPADRESSEALISAANAYLSRLPGHSAHLRG